MAGTFPLAPSQLAPAGLRLPRQSDLRALLVVLLSAALLASVLTVADDRFAIDAGTTSQDGSVSSAVDDVATSSSQTVLPGEVPEGLTASEWADIQAQIAARQGPTAVTAQPSPLVQAPTTVAPLSVVPVPAAPGDAPAARFSLALPSAAVMSSAGVDASFSPISASITTSSSADAVVLSTSTIGSSPVGSAVVRETAAGVELVRAGATEYFHTVAEGIEHGYVIDRPMHTGDDLVIRVDVADGTPTVSGDDVVITRPDGSTVGYRDLYVFDATGAELPSFMAVDGAAITLNVDTTGAIYPITVDPVITEDATVTPLQNASGERSGTAVAVDGDTVIVSSPFDNDTGPDRGKVEVFDYNSGTGSLTYDSAWYGGINADSDYGFNVALVGDTFVVGAPGDSLNGADAGAVYVYTRSGTSWQLSQTLYACSTAGCDTTDTGDGIVGDRFGEAVALADDEQRLVVGAPQYSVVGGEGRVLVIDLAAPTSLGQILTGGIIDPGDAFGAAVDVSSNGNLIAVGAPLDDVSGVPDAGNVSVFAEIGGSFTEQLDQLLVPGAANVDGWGYYGGAVAIEDVGPAQDPTLLVSQPFYTRAPGSTNPGSPKQGVVYAWELDETSAYAGAIGNTQFIQEGTPGNGYGFSLAVRDNYAIIGAPFVGSNGDVDVLVYDNAGVPNNDYVDAGIPALAFGAGETTSQAGFAVSIGSNLEVAIGQPGFDSANEIDGGTVRVWDDVTAPPVTESIVDSFTGAQGDQFGAAVALDGNRLAVAAVLDDEPAANSGSVQIYERTAPGDPWVFQQILVPPLGFATVDGGFGNALALNDTVLAVGQTHVGTSDNGWVHVYQRSGSTWTLFTTFSGAGAGVELGKSIAIPNTDTVLLGAPGFGVGGAVFEFTFSGGGLNTFFLGESPEAGDLVGYSLDAYPTSAGYTLAVGAPGDDDQGTDAGAVYILERGAAFPPVPIEKEDGGAAWGAGDRVGASIAADHDRIAAAGLGDGLIGDGYGVHVIEETAADVYAVTDSITGTLINAVTGGPNDFVDIYGGTIALARPGGGGQVDLFRYTGTDWPSAPNDALVPAGTSAGDRVGFSVDLDGHTLVAGIPGDEPPLTAASTDSGAVATVEIPLVATMTSGTDWSTAANWDVGEVPGSGDVGILVPSLGIVGPVPTTAIGELIVGTGTTVSVDPVATLTIEGIDDAATATTTVNGALDMPGTAALVLETDITNLGTVFVAGDMTLQGADPVQLNGNGTWDIDGTLTKDSPGTTTVAAGANWAADPGSTINVNTGTLAFDSLALDNGTINLAAGTLLQHNATGGLNASGTYNFEITGDSTSTANYGRVVFAGPGGVTGTVNTSVNGYTIAGGEDYLLVDCQTGTNCDTTLAGSTTPDLTIVQTPGELRAQAAPNPCDVEWTGAINNLWSEAGNWNGGVPISTDVVCMDVGGGTTVTVDGAQEIGSFDSAQEDLVITGSLIVNGTSFIDGAVTINGTLDGDGDIILNGGGTLDGGTIRGLVSVPNAVAFTIVDGSIDGEAAADPLVANFINDGIVTVTGTPLLISNGASIGNNGTWTFDSAVAQEIQIANPGTSTFTNSAVFGKQGAGTLTMPSGVTFDMGSGSAFQVLDGTVGFFMDGTWTGAPNSIDIEVSPGAVLTLAGNQTMSGQLNGLPAATPGSATFLGTKTVPTALTLDFPTGMLLVSVATVNGPGVLTNSTDLRVAGGSVLNADIINNGTLTFEGAAVINGTIDTNLATVVMGGNVSYGLTGTGGIDYTFGGITINHVSIAGITLGPDLTLSGDTNSTLDIGPGTVFLQSDFVNTGALNLSSGTLLRTNGNVVLDSSGSVTFDISGNSTTASNYSQWDVVAPGTLVLGGELARSGAYAPTPVDSYGIIIGCNCPAETFDTVSIAPLTVDIGLNNVILDGPVPGPLVVDTANDVVAADGLCSMREAINAANGAPGTGECGTSDVADVIEFASPLAITLGSRLPVITSDITLDGSSAPGVSISGSTSVAILRIESSGTLTLNELDIIDGRQQTCDGGDTCGAVLNYGSLTVTNSRFAGHNATGFGNGGAITNRGGGDLVVDGTTFESNNANTAAGAIWNASDASGTVTTATITNSTFNNNTGGGSGAIYNTFNATMTIANSTFVANTATSGGPTVNNAGGATADLTITNSTFTDNVGGFSLSNAAPSTMTVSNSIITSTTAGTACNAGAQPTADSSNLDDDGTCGSATTVTLAELDLGTLADNGGPTETVALGAASVAIGAGDTATCAASPVNGVDQRGIARVADVCDTGAFGVPTHIVNDTGDGTDAIPGDGVCETGPGNGTCTFRAALQESNQDEVDVDRIHFDIAGAGTHTISPGGSLPTIRGNVIIDATTEPGADCSTWPPSLTVEVDLAQTLAVQNGAFIRGLVINNWSFPSDGIAISGVDTTFECNFIGTNATATALSGEGASTVVVDGSGHRIGGPAATQANVIGGSSNTQVFLRSDGATIQGNFVNTDPSGAPLPSVGGVVRQEAFYVTGSNNLIGGTNPGEGNRIAGVNGQAVQLVSGTGNSIRGNSISGHAGLGIDNDPAPFVGGVTPNDPDDVDGGPNNTQNFPVLSSAIQQGATTQLTGFLDSTPSRTFEIDVFSNGACDASGNGEGEFYLGTFNVTTDASGDATFDEAFPAALMTTDVVTLTATDMTTGDTSEFSACQTVAPDFVPGPPVVAIDGEWAVVTVPAQGEAFVLRNIAGTWTDVQTISGGGVTGFGASVALNDPYLAIGSPASGRVDFYERPAGGSTFDVSFAQADVTGYGTSLDISTASLIVIGSPEGNGGALGSGVANVYDLNTGGFVFNTIQGAMGDRVGEQVAITETAVYVAAPGSDIGATDSGVVYRYDVAGALQETLQGSGSSDGRQYGIEIDATSDRVAIASATGTAVDVDPVTGPTFALNRPSGGLGEAVALSGDLFVVDDGVGLVATVLSDNGSDMNYNIDTNIAGTFSDIGVDGGTLVFAFEPTGTAVSGLDVASFLASPVSGPFAKVLPDIGSAGDQFGSNVAIDGDTMVVGAAQADVSGTDEGAIYVFERTGVTWTQTQRISDQLGSGRAVAIEGDVLVAAVSAGVAVYTRTGFGSPFTPVSSPVIAMAGPPRTIEIDGATLVLGVPNALAGSGEVQVYLGGTDGWTSGAPQVITGNTGRTATDRLGTSADISGNTLVVGAPLSASLSAPPGAAGYAEVYTRASAADPFTFAYLLEADIIDDLFGWSVAIEGSVIAVGAPRDSSGIVHVYDDSGSGSPVATLADGVDAFGYAIDIDAGVLAVGEFTDSVRGYDVTSGGASSTTVAVHTDFEPQDTAAGSTPVATSARTIVSGARLEDQQGSDAGAVYVFELPDVVPANKLESDAGLGQTGYGTGIDIEGDVAYISQTNPGNVGSAVLKRTVRDPLTGVWQTQVNSTPGAQDVEMSATHVAFVGADGNDVSVAPVGGGPVELSVTASSPAIDLEGDLLIVGEPVPGQVRIFEWDGGTTWTEVFSTTGAFGTFGSDVAIDGDLAVVADTSNLIPGSVMVYQRSGATWQATPVATLTNPDSTTTDDAWFGSSVDLAGPTLVVGHSLNHFPSEDEGVVWVYDGPPSTYGTQSPELLVPSAGGTGDVFGQEVQIDGDFIAVGAPAHNVSGDLFRSGGAFVFSRSGSSWTEVAYLLPQDREGDARFGESLSIDDVGTSANVLVGAPLDDNNNGVDAGAVYWFEVEGADNPTLTFDLGLASLPPTIAGGAGIPISVLGDAAPLIEENADNESSVGSTSLQDTGVAESALAGIQLSDTPFSSIAAGIPELRDLPLLSIGIDAEGGWAEILAPFPEFEGLPLVNITVGDVFGNPNPALASTIGALPFSSIDVNGTPFSSIPFSSIAMGEVPVDQIPLDADRTSPSEIAEDWCGVLSGTPVACGAGNALDPNATLMSIALSDVPFSSIPFSSIPFSSIPLDGIDASGAVVAAPFSSIPLSQVNLDATPFSSIPFSSIPFSSIPVGDTPFSSIPFSSIPFSSIPFSSIPFSSIGVGGTPFSSIPFSSIPFSSIDVNGAPFSSIPFSSIALADVSLTDIPLDATRTDPTEIAADWCSLLADFNVDCAGLDLSQTTITDVGVRGVPFSSIPFSSIPFSSIPFSSIPFSSIPFSSIPFSSIPLGSTDLSLISLEGTPFSSIPFSSIAGPVAAPFSSIPFSSIDVQGSPFSSILLRDLNTVSTPFSSIPFSSIPFSSIPFSSIPFSSIPFSSIDVGGTPFSSIPFSSIDLLSSPFSSIPFSSIPFSSIDGVIADCSRVDCLNGTLGDAVLAGALVPGATLGDLEGFLDGYRLPDVADYLSGFTADDIENAVAAWADGNSIDLAAVLDFGDLSLGDLPVDHPLFRQTVLGDIVGGLANVTFGDLARALLAPGVADPEAELEAVVDQHADDANLSIDTMLTFGDVTFGEILPALQGSLFGELGSFLAFVHLADLGFSSGDLATALGSANGTGDSGEWLVIDAVNDATLNLGDILLADLLGSAEWGAATVRDLVEALPDEEVAGFTLADLLLGLLPEGTLPWGLAFENIDAAEIPGVMPPVTLRADFSLTGSRERTIEVSVELPTNTAYVPGSSTITPAVDGDLEPVEVGGQLVWTFSGIQPGVDDVTPGVTYQLDFDVQPTLRIGATSIGGDGRVVGAEQTIASTALVSVLEAFEPNNNPAEAGEALEDTIYLVHVSSDTDVDMFYVDIGENESLAVDLSGLPADFDVVLYSDLGAPVASTALTQTADADPLVPVLDPDADGTETLPDQSFPRFDLDPAYPNLALVELSNGRGTDDETIVTERLPGGRYYIQIHGHDGASSPEPAVLQINVVPAEDVPACTARGPLPVATPGGAIDPNTLPADLNTVFLINEQRFEQIFGAAGRTQVTTALDNLVAAFSTDPEISTLGLSGAVIAVDGDEDVRNAYAAWDDPASPEDACNPATANAIVSTIISDVLQPIRDVRDIEHVVLIGSDDLLPFARLTDATVVANEFDYRHDLSQRNAFTSSFWASTILSDDPYGETSALPFGDRFIYLPDAAIGRLLETPQSIADQIDQFIAFDGFLAADTGLVAGYDFLIDGSEAIADELAVAISAPDLDRELADGTTAAGPLWSASDIFDALFTGVPAGDNGPDIVSLNAHFDHYRALPAEGDQVPGFSDNFEVFAVDGLADDDLLDGSLIYSMGCHSGLNVPNTMTAEATDVLLDWAESFTDQEAIYVGNTGFGYGDTETVGYTERLLQLFSRNLAAPVAADLADPSTQTTIGQALQFAKQEAFSELPDVSVYHEKALQESTMYGLPFYRLGVPPVLPAPAPNNNPAPELLTGDPAVSYIVDAQNQPNTVGGEVFYSNIDDNGDPSTITQPGRPIQPTLVVDITDVDPADPSQLESEARGAIITDMTSTYITPVDPVVSVPVFDESSQAVEPDIDGIVYPTVPQSIKTFERPEGTRQNLVLATGQYRGTEDQGTQRLDDDIDVVVYYTDPSDPDRSPPAIVDVDSVLTGSQLSITVDVNDGGAGSGVDRVYVLVTPEPGQASAEWFGTDLLLSPTVPGRWVGGYTFASAPTDIEFIVQVKDGAGNVGVSTNKAVNFGEEEEAPPAPVNLDVTVSGTVAGDPVGGIYRGDVNVSAQAAGLPISYQLDGGGFQDFPEPGPLVVTGDGFHTLEVVAANGDRSVLTIRIDTTDPVATISTPALGQVFTVGQAVAASFSCQDASPVTCQGEVTGPTGTTLTTGQDLPTSVAGTYTLTVTATDSLGNIDEAQETYDVIVPDTTAPIVTIDAPAPNTVVTQGDLLTATFTCADLESAVTSCTGQVAGAASGLTSPTALPTGSIGTFVLSVTGTNEFGLVDSASITYVVEAPDTDPPVIDIASPAAGTFVMLDGLLTATFTCEDAENDPSDCVGEVSGPDTATGLASGDALPTGVEGLYTLTVTGTDDLGNATTASVDYSVDDTAPTVTITVPVDGDVVASGVSLLADYECSDDQPGVTCEGELSGDGSGAVADGAALETGSSGIYTLSVTGTDAAGNVTVETATYEVDGTPPTITLTGPTDGTIVGVEATLNGVFSCLDDVSEPSSCVGEVSGPDTATGLISGDALPTAVAGDYTLTVTGTDDLGNSTTDSVTYTVDDTPPTVTIDEPVDGSIVGLGASLTADFDCADDEAGVTCDAELSGTGPVALGDVLPTTAGGSFTLTVTGTDVAGNETVETATYIVDAAGPTVTVTTPADGDFIAADATLVADFDCSDLLSEPSTCTAELFGPAPQSGIESGDALPTTLAGEYTLVITGTDAVGNATTETVVYTISAPPVITDIFAPSEPTLISDGVFVDAVFTDSEGDAGTYTLTIDYGDADEDDPASVSTTCTVTTSEPVSAVPGGPSCELEGWSLDPAGVPTNFVASNFVYAEPGVYTVTVTVTDESGGSDSWAYERFVVVYDPDAGRVSGAGWFWSDDSSYQDDDTHGEWAYFGYRARYRGDDPTPTGRTRLLLWGDFNFRSTGYDYLIINDTLAVAEGVGRFNGQNGYRFRVQGIDNGRTDFFQITIWEPGEGGDVVYDNGVLFDPAGDEEGDEVIFGGIRIRS